MQTLSNLLGIQPGEAFRIGVMSAVLSLLIAANNLIKVVRDTVFLGHHSASELPYLYLLVAFLAGTIVVLYSKYTANISLTKLIYVTNGIILSNIVFFWILLTYFDPGWSHYAFYVWSAISGVIAIAQAWTLANEIFTSQEAERVFGLLAAGGTIGGAAAAFGAAAAIEQSLEVNELLWFVVLAVLAASFIIFWANRRLADRSIVQSSGSQKQADNGTDGEISAILGRSRYLKTIGLVILLSVIVSTLIDFEFKVAAKETHRSQHALAAFFSSYYGWLSIATFLVQSLLTGRVLSTLGLFSSLYITPGVLFTGTVTLLMWPSLLVAALTRIADAALRNSVHRSGLELLYMPLSSKLKKTMKTFLDVVAERVGDAAAGVLILLFSFFFTESYVNTVHVICVGLIFIWILLIPVLRIGHTRAVAQSDNIIRRRFVLD